jgi:hypothetical protein
VATSTRPSAEQRRPLDQACLRRQARCYRPRQIDVSGPIAADAERRVWHTQLGRVRELAAQAVVTDAVGQALSLPLAAVPSGRLAGSRADGAPERG